MPLPKELKAALDAWKAGTGEYPGALDDGVFFPTEGAFHAEVSKKAKGREKAGGDAALKSVMDHLGISDPAELEKIRETLEQTGVFKTEAEKSKAATAKLAKDLEDSKKESDTLKQTIAQHTEKIRGIAKRDALSKYASRVVDPDALNLFVSGSLEVAEDGTVKIKGDDKKTLDQLVDETIKAKPYLANPTFKSGPAVKPKPETEVRTDLPYKAPDGGQLTTVQRTMNELVAKGVIPAPGAATVGGGP